MQKSGLAAARGDGCLDDAQCIINALHELRHNDVPLERLLGLRHPLRQAEDEVALSDPFWQDQKLEDQLGQRTFFDFDSSPGSPGWAFKACFGSRLNGWKAPVLYDSHLSSQQRLTSKQRLQGVLGVV